MSEGAVAAIAIVPPAVATAKHGLASRHIPSLDGVRAISFLLVFVAHAGLDAIVPGGFGVTVFFFLSGYLITTLMRSEYERSGTVNLGHFWLRRVLRIFPPFYLVLLLATAITPFWEPSSATLSVSAVAAQALYFTNYQIILHGYAGQPVGTGVFWSLAVEEHFYLLFPFLYLGMRRLRLTGHSQACLLWTLCGIVLCWRIVLVTHFHVAADRTYMGSDTRMDSILFGCALAVWNNPMLDEPVGSERAWKYGLLPMALVLLVFCMIYRAADFRETGRYSLQGIALTPIFIAAMRFPGWFPFRILNWRPVAYIGVLSYALYLVHLVVIYAVQRWVQITSWLQELLALMIALAVAWLIHLYVEKPCARVRRRLSA